MEYGAYSLEGTGSDSTCSTGENAHKTGFMVLVGKAFIAISEESQA
jgi:hypothetical protein